VKINNNKIKINILTGSHLTDNPRVWKEASALNKAGFNVSIFTTWYSSQKLNHDSKLIDNSIDYISVINLIPSLNNILFVIYAKAIKRIALYLFRYFKISSIYQQVYLPKWQLKKILKHPCELFICHQETGLFLGNYLIKKGYKVAFDFEDLYSEDYLNRYRPVGLLKKSELFALNNAVYVTCPSKSMAEYFQMLSPSGKHVNVIYNSFPIIRHPETELQKIPNSLLWFSQTIGPKRGIEELVKSLKLIEQSLNITFIGSVSDSYKYFILDQLSCSTHEVKFIPLLSNSDLLYYIKRFEIGLALELSTPISRDLTITNKILLYLQSNLKVIASKTAGHLELQEYFPGQIKYVDLNNTINFAESIKDIILSSANKLNYYFNNKYSWAKSAERLVKLVESSVHN